ncbi:MAG: C40 family peptidase [Crocinitomicaceae bacterium]|nr:C40 family peptidase [Crocinitomicaceae bacterium]
MDVSAYCTVSISPVRSQPQDSSEMVTQLLFGEIVDIIEETPKWWKIRSYFDNYEGWVDPKQVKKLSKKEVGRWLNGLSYLNDLVTTIETTFGPQRIVRGSFISHDSETSFAIGNDHFGITTPFSNTNYSSVTEIAKEYLNTPYLWGGKTPFGIDCSGFTQVCFRLIGINLPRDASQQVEHGAAIDFSDRLAGDVVFFSNDAGKVIHVGICLSDSEIIHASGQVRIDKYDEQGIIHYSGEYHTHQFHSIKRMA